MTRSVPLSRSTLRVGGGSAFYVRRQSMICPYCNNDSPYTWRRYWRSLFSRVRCLACGRVFKVRPKRRDLFIGICILLLAVITPSGLYILLDFPIYLLPIPFVGYAVLVYFDRVMEMRGTPISKNHDA